MSGTLLGGRVAYEQAARGNRTGIEPVLLAAAIPARPGERVVEAGCGAGAALLCLAARVPGLVGLGIERDAETAALAARNVSRNAGRNDATLAILAGDLLDAALPPGPYDHAFANPPWHDRHSSASPMPSRDLARRGAPGLLGAWCARLARMLRHRGSLTLVLQAGLLGEACAAMSAAGCGAASLLPLWPRAGMAAKLVLVQARRGARGPGTMEAGLVLHEGDGYALAARAVLQDGGAIGWSGR